MLLVSLFGGKSRPSGSVYGQPRPAAVAKGTGGHGEQLDGIEVSVLRLGVGRLVAGATVVIACALAHAPLARATSEQMQALPSFSGPGNGCTFCHAGVAVTETSVPPSSTSSLTAFGIDWVTAGRQWGASLAHANSDGDGCTNGWELGDSSGTWRPGGDSGTSDRPAQSNPALNDCALPLDEQSWGVLKAFFEEEGR
jgi:hypothetical protein